MFWGKGDSARLTEEERVTLDDLRRLVETGHLVALSPEQTEVAVAAINAYAMVRSAWVLVIGFRNALVIAGALLGFWWIGHDAVIGFIQSVAAGGAGK